MAWLIESTDPTSASVEEVRDALAVWGFDPAEEESIAHAAHWLRRLGNDRDFLGDLLIGMLAGRPPAGEVGIDVGETNRIVLAAPGRGNFSLSASIWPSQEENVLRASGPEAFAYGTAHDHHHDFLVLGYFGPGVEFENYEYRYETVAGWRGEPVDLHPLGRSRLEPGALFHYRAHRDIHVVHPPQSLSVALTLSHEHAAKGWMDHYLFDVEAGCIARVLGHGPSEAFLRIAVALGGEEAKDLAARFGRHHPSDRMRLSAWRALAACAGNREAQDAVWAEAEACGSRVVEAAAAARRRAISP
ncbi:hypothetical protein [Novosphingobium sp. P6W]|uniref:hypothetical protein n=1 Tax=Novosphingobium sp. P6W TaxID=1609758 RepID=UPI0005C2CF42|nr:hypothetical protein [Novosphingobium sp. P6W]AXB77675.1 transposase [Novosphingobium sp. P6W]KIS34023.1 transposase [Novosphingobium sp. P6W]